MIHYTAEREREGTLPCFRNLKSVIVPNGLEMDDLLSIPALEEDHPVSRLLICGRVHKTKGFDHLVPALAILRRQGVAVHLVVAGQDEGGYRTVVEQMAR